MIGTLAQLDQSLFEWVVGHRSEILTMPMLGASEIGRGGLIWLAIGACLLLIRRIRGIHLVELAVAILLASTMSNRILKPAFVRERPFRVVPHTTVIGPPQSDNSFPSGHSSNAFAGAYVLAQVVPEARVVWWATAVVIAYSRIYLGVHYPLDVTGGALVGFVCGVCSMAAGAAIRRGIARRKDRDTAPP